MDNVQTFLFGQNDFVASYSGLKQPMLMKYNLSPNQTVSANPAPGTEVTTSSISVPFTVTVVANQLAAPIKLSVIPQWNLGTSSYELQFYYYSTDHNRATNVTNFVTIPNGVFTGNNFTTWQSFSFTIDMNNVDPVNYPSFAPYTQNVALKFQPPAALVRYLIADSLSSSVIYGADSSACRRPVLYCDTSTNQYFLSSLLFQNSAAILQAFYYNASPPYNTNTETTPPVPTHFTIRNPNTGGLILTSPIPLTNYTSAFSLVNGSDGYYVGGTVIVEFLQISGDSSTYILYGVPVDVHEATYIGPSNT